MRTLGLLAGLALASHFGSAPPEERFAPAIPPQPAADVGLIAGVDGGYPVAITGSLTVTPPAVQVVQGLDAGYPVKVDQGAAGASGWKVDGSGVTQPVSGTFFQATQPVSIASMPTTPVTGTFFQVTQPVSIAGTVNTSDAHTTAAAPLACRLSDGAAFYAGPAGAQLPAALDGSGFLKTHEQGTAPVSGTFWQATQPVSGTFWQATQPVSGTFWQATQPISGHVDGTVATNAAITQNPMLIGAEAQSGQPAAATTGNQRQLISNLDGALFTVNGGPNRVNGGFNSVAATLTGVLAAPGAGLFNYVDAIYIGSTTATAGTYAVTCGTGSACVTTNVAFFPVSGTANRFNYPPNTTGMAVITMNPPLRCPTANQLVCITCVATNTCSGQIEGHIGH